MLEAAESREEEEDRLAYTNRAVADFVAESLNGSFMGLMPESGPYSAASPKSRNTRHLRSQQISPVTKHQSMAARRKVLNWTRGEWPMVRKSRAIASKPRARLEKSRMIRSVCFPLKSLLLHS